MPPSDKLITCTQDKGIIYAVKCSMLIQVVVLLKILLSVHSYTILALFPHRGKSHANVFLTLTQALAKKGHEVTAISYFPLKTPLPNYIDITLGNSSSHFIDRINLNDYQGLRTERWFILRTLNNFSLGMCQQDLSSPSLGDFLKSGPKFDVVLTEYFNCDCFLSVLHKFKSPVIGVSSSTVMHWTNEIFANPTNPAYVPNNLLNFSDRMAFWERVENFVLGLWQTFYYEFFMLPDGEEIAKRFHNFASLRDIVFNSSLLLVNSHFTLNLPRPLVPAVVEIGGVHIVGVEKLPQNLEKWINESAHGVIYFSLGSMIKGHTFPDEKRSEFLKAFGRLPQRVLWKWENETMSGKPDNVMIQKWMPQLDILCHPNVKAFISHGGLLGTTEAVHCGVPVVVMPQYGDQFTNARALEANGGGVILHLSEATEERIYDALKTILDPRFQKQAKELSARFRDRPLPPLETAIYWVEYVARHRGAHHMRTAAVDMPLYKYLLLDVIAFLVLVAGLLFALFFYATRAILRKLFTKRDKQKTN
ncbi:UDP-glycosyltransferase UGT5 isoform X1 [Tribolium castaneum]|uniref:UDP-glycosyltransferase UGT5 isoform X1 n=1 Tax=Tribolium castaneum TaxID=7070 RepID=UPI0000D55CF6|nr:PREDICTED: UDP-glucuronosyltransferase 1-7C isoform X1 [Tribolium castaneum]|eukprot:XP_008191815.1 PREDICTED: UDP-glucuronosyltransferase 1-7C isoform X1 [Tribolium castaneum]